jgi:hypothetical protein
VKEPPGGIGFWLIQGTPSWSMDAVALIDLDRRAGATAVVAPGVDGFEGSDLALQGLGLQAKHFDGAVEFKGKIGHVGGDDRRGRFWRGTVVARGLLRVCAIRGRVDALRICLTAPSKQAGAQQCSVLQETSACTAHNDPPTEFQIETHKA